jgi:hypothetical protein
VPLNICGSVAGAAMPARQCIMRRRQQGKPSLKEQLSADASEADRWSSSLIAWDTLLTEMQAGCNLQGGQPPIVQIVG